MSIPQNIGIEIRNITFKNRRLKFRKAVGELAKTLDVPMELLKAGHKEHSHEAYLYGVQQELSDRWVRFFDVIVRGVYSAVVDATGLPRVEVETLRKALDDGILRYRGKVIYSPETGQPIQKKEFDALIKAIENFLNRKTSGAGERIILDSVAIGKILRRMGKYQTSKEMQSLTLETLKYRGKTFDWISDSVKNVHTTLGDEISRNEQAMYQATQDWAAAKVSSITDDIRNEIKETLLYGIREHRSKSQVSQDLFNKLGGLNRDWKRIADTEMVNTSNLAGIMEEVNQAPEGEKVYFKRYELPGCCDKCEKINGMVVLWSNTPLESDKIKDEHAKVAIWEGKPQDRKMNSVVTGTMHPNCRGGWARWNSGYVDAYVAHIQNKTQMWDRAVETARKEFKEKGIEYPNDQTKGYTDRINEIYRTLTE